MKNDLNRISGLCLLVIAAFFLAACVTGETQTAQTAETTTDSAGLQPPAAAPPVVDFPADRNPSWITAAHPQEIHDEQAAAELTALGLEFGGKQFVEQAIAGNRRAIELFLKAGIHPDTRSLGGTTALMAAAANGHTGIARLLVDSGADVTLREYRTTEMTALLYAVQNGSAELAAYLLDHGADVNECDVRLETALYKAVTEQHQELVGLLLERGADVERRSMRLTTPLTYGTGYLSLEIVKLLVEAGADVNAVDSSGATPLLVAAKFGKGENFHYLLEQGATNFGESFTGYNCLHAAAESGALDIASSLLERGFDINAPDRRTAANPLLIAVAYQHVALAKWLLANGADPRPRCIFGYSALDLIRRLHKDCAARTAEQRELDELPELDAVEELLDMAEQAAAGRARTVRETAIQEPDDDSIAVDQRRPDSAVNPLLPAPSLDDETLAAIDRIPAAELSSLTEQQARQLLEDHGIDFTPEAFIETCMFGWRKLFQVFLAAGIDPNAKRADGGNAITAACLLGDVEMVQTLIDQGADLDSTFGENEMPCMHYAVLGRAQRVVDLLLANGQSIDDRDAGGRTALTRAAEQGNLAMIEYLIDQGADLDASNNAGLTALHWALRSGQIKAVKLLVERGADFESADEYGITPAFAAAMFGQPEIYQFLRDHGAKIDRVLNDGTTIIHAAVAGGQEEIVRDVLNAGYDLNYRHPERGDTPIYGALDRLDADINFIRFLLAAGAEVNVFDDLVGYSPLMVAALNSNVEIFNLLIDHGADYTAVSENGVTVLHVATMNDSPEMVSKLLELGVDVWAEDGEGKTALDRAIEFRCNRVEPILREAMGLPATSNPADSGDK